MINDAIKSQAFYKNKEDIIDWLAKNDISQYNLVAHPLYGFVVDVLQDVKFLDKGRSISIDIKFNVIHGHFDCSGMELEDLNFAPIKVYGDFLCHDNSLTSLVGAPQIVKGEFNCQNNLLTSLEGAPAKVVEFNCSRNKLQSLMGGPAIVLSDYDCTHNKLVSLKGCPQTIEENFYAYDNELKSLEGGPQIIKGGYWAAQNRISTLEFLPDIVEHSINLEPNLLLGVIQKETNLERMREQWRIKTEKKQLEAKIDSIEKNDKLQQSTFKI